MISAALNSLTAIEIDNDTIMGMIQSAFSEYIYGIDEIDLIKNNKIHKNDEFFSKSSSYKHPMTSSVLINTTIYGRSNISINIRIPVIAEGKGYI
ncbi:hypothetical protein ELS18_12310 [Clostridium perfringens]|uniref:hypothetical protein n=1 Tax=Clostridium perfringens TaxID=1502 RepID=UPI000F8EADC0|nr:hypothetical protein [Clostridium perfringens]RUR36872.1 hypothetical protein ELS18_12310 [Clostridium perfringens]